MGEDLLYFYYSNKIQPVSFKNVHMIINLLTKRILISITLKNISKSFTYLMAAKTSWHRYGTKLRHCNPMYTSFDV